MSLLETLEESLQSDAPSYIDFLYRYDPKKKQVFAFYEGDEDSSFYHHVIKSIIDKDCELEEIVAGCKNNVLKLHREFDRNAYSNRQLAFFVDRDLSFWLGETSSYGDNVFVTDEYSVENYVVNAVGFEAWIVHFEGFSRAQKKELEFMVSEFELNIAKFKDKMMNVMAKAVVAKRHDKSVSLKEFKIGNGYGKCFKLENGHVEFDIPDENIPKGWGLTDEDDEEIHIQIGAFEKNKKNYSVRGKWILSFMAELGEYMRLHADKFAPSLGCKGKLSCTCSVPASQCLSVLASYCAEPVPTRLSEFLKRTYIEYLADIV